MICPGKCSVCPWEKFVFFCSWVKFSVNVWSIFSLVLVHFCYFLIEFFSGSSTHYIEWWTEDSYYCVGDCFFFSSVNVYTFEALMLCAYICINNVFGQLMVLSLYNVLLCIFYRYFICDYHGDYVNYFKLVTSITFKNFCLHNFVISFIVSFYILYPLT